MKVLLLLTIASALILAPACRPFFIEDDDDHEPRDTTRVLDDLCFEVDVLPILRANCATSGCHDAASARDGVILESYASIMSGPKDLVRPFDPWDSELWEVLVEDEADERMPPSPRSLSQFQIDVVRQWIQEGARNDVCSDSGLCDTSNVTFARIRPILEQYCWSCHSNAAAAANIRLQDYPDVVEMMASGRLIRSIERTGPGTPMPPASSLPGCEILLFKAWQVQGLLP